VQDVIDLLEVPQPLVSYHLRRLRERDLIQAQRIGRGVYYALDGDAWVADIGPMRQLCALIEMPATLTSR